MKKAFKKLKGKLHSMKQAHLDNFVFIHINKTAGSSVEKALGLPFEHKTALEKIEQIGRDSWDQKYTFTIVRNPWDKVVSHFHYRVRSNQTGLGDEHIGFKEWMTRAYGEQDERYYDIPKMFMPQLDWLTDKNGNVLVDDVLRFENISSEFDRVLAKLGRKATLPHIKCSEHADYREYYDAETTEIVRRWFERDIVAFDYPL